MEKIHPDGFFQFVTKSHKDFFNYQLLITLQDDHTYTIEDPYRFSPVLSEDDLFLFNEGNHFKLYEKFGAQLITHEDIAGVSFAVWAPNASRVSVVGDFNGWDGRRHVLAVELANRESASSWKDHLVRLKERGLHGVRLAASDDHAGLKRAIMETLPEAHWQRCYVHFLRNALDHLPRSADRACLQELRWLYDRHTAEEARRDLAQWLARWQDKHPKLCTWVEANIDETFAFYRLPREHHKHLKSTNMLERLNQEIKRRTLLVRIFPDEPSCLRLVQALAVEIHEEWVDENRYLDMELLREHLKRLAATQPKAA